MGLGSFDARVPRHLWIVGVLSLLWNSVGAFDYVMTETRNADYLRGFTPEQLAYFTGFPKWVVAAWALAVWGGVAGSLGLLWRQRWAVPVFGLSLAAMAVTFTHNFRVFSAAGPPPPWAGRACRIWLPASACSGPASQPARRASSSSVSRLQKKTTSRSTRSITAANGACSSAVKRG